MNTLNYRDYPEFMFAIVASYLTPEEGRDIRRCAGKTIYRYSKNGDTYKNGTLHSYDDKNGDTYKNGALHSYDDKPAVITKTAQMWYNDGIPHREADKPAFITSYREEWWSKGKIHRDGDLPAVV